MTITAAIQPAPDSRGKNSMTRNLWALFAQHAYGYREIGIAVFAFGIFLHTSRLLFGDESLRHSLLSPIADEIFAVPMAYAAIAGLVGWKSLKFRGHGHEIFSKVVLAFIAISVPLHVATYFGAPMSRFSVFPMWYSLIEAAVAYPAFATGLALLQFRDSPRKSAN